jgi:signal recognition particle receptor subunit beta
MRRRGAHRDFSCERRLTGDRGGRGGSDHGRLQVARQELQSLCPTLRSRRLPVLLLANKQDVLDAMSIAAVGAAMADVLGALRRRDGGGEAEEGCATWVAGCSAGDTASVQAALEWVLARAQRS